MHADSMIMIMSLSWSRTSPYGCIYNNMCTYICNDNGLYTTTNAVPLFDLCAWSCEESLWYRLYSLLHV